MMSVRYENCVRITLFHRFLLLAGILKNSSESFCMENLLSQ